MEQHKDELLAAGFGQLLNIGLGQPKHAQKYCDKIAPSLPCFAATTNDPYYAWGLHKQGLGDLVGNAFNVVGATLRAARSGQSQDEVTGDSAMMPGTFIVDRAGVVQYTYYSHYAGDDPDIPTLITSLKAMK